jgi:hypothetical protein
MPFNTYTQTAYGHAFVITDEILAALAEATGNTDSFADDYDLVEELNQLFNHIELETNLDEAGNILSIYVPEHSYIPEAQNSKILLIRLAEPSLSEEVVADFERVEELLKISSSERGWFFMQLIS